MISSDNQRCCICSSETIVAKQARSVNERPGESIRRRLMGMKAGLKLGLQKWMVSTKHYSSMCGFFTWFHFHFDPDHPRCIWQRLAWFLHRWRCTPALAQSGREEMTSEFSDRKASHHVRMGLKLAPYSDGLLSSLSPFWWLFGDLRGCTGCTPFSDTPMCNTRFIEIGWCEHPQSSTPHNEVVWLHWASSCGVKRCLGLWPQHLPLWLSYGRGGKWREDGIGTSCEAVKPTCHTALKVRKCHSF